MLRKSGGRIDFVGIGIVFLFLLLLPLFVPVYWTMIATEIVIMGLFAMSFNLLFGYSGLLSFGQAGFFGVGAYTAALLITHGTKSYFLIFFVSLFATGIISLIIGFLCVKRDEIFFAMLSLAFGMMLYTVAHNWRELTGGSDGLPLDMVPQMHVFGKSVSLFKPLNVYYFSLVFVFLGICVLKLVVNSHFGLMLKASRENKERLSFSGGNVLLIRLIAFTIAGILAGLSGILFCLYNRMATPDMLHWSFSAKPVLMSILGGTNVFWGPFLGAAIFFLLEQLVTSITENWMIVLGFILIPIVLFFPSGVLGSIWNKLSGKIEYGVEHDQ